MKCSFKLPRDKSIHKLYAKEWLKVCKGIEDELKECPFDVKNYYYFIGINEFGDLYQFQKADINPIITGEHLLVPNSGKRALLELDRYGTLSYKTKEESDKVFKYLRTTHEIIE
jgi:hypothetical protein